MYLLNVWTGVPAYLRWKKRCLCTSQILRIQVKKCDNYLVSESQLQNTPGGNQLQWAKLSYQTGILNDKNALL